MIRFIYADQLSHYPLLAESMFKDRAAQFKDRLDWDVTVDENGWEVDEYDRLNPLYIIWENAEGRHGGSVRIMPTVGRTMTNEHFRDLTGGVSIRSPLIWECTRFCLAPDAPVGRGGGAARGGGRARPALRAGAGGRRDLRQDRRRSTGASAGARTSSAAGGEGRDRISVGLWPITVEARAEISRRSGIPLSVMARWFDASFPARASRSASPPDASDQADSWGRVRSGAGTRLPLPLGLGERQAEAHGVFGRSGAGAGPHRGGAARRRGRPRRRRRCCPRAAGRSRRWR